MRARSCSTASRSRSPARPTPSPAASAWSTSTSCSSRSSAWPRTSSSATRRWPTRSSSTSTSREGRIRELATQLGFEIDPDAKVGDLSVGIQQRIEILKALYRGAKVLILDEPTAVLTPQETVEIFAVLRRLAAEGTSIVFISHKLYEVLEIADRITVIRRGKVVGQADPKTATEEDLAEMMVGREVSLIVDKGPAHPGDVVLRVTDLTVADDRGIDGRRRLQLRGPRRARSSASPASPGTARTSSSRRSTGSAGRPAGRSAARREDITNHSSRDLSERGIAYIPGDRQRFGLVLPYPIEDNLVLTDYYHAPFSRYGVIDEGAIEPAGRGADPAVRHPDAVGDVPASTLSGGNQQKVIVAREFSRDLKLLIADQPTRGIDVGSIEFIHKQIVAKRDAGTAVLLVSAELDEVLELSRPDRGDVPRPARGDPRRGERREGRDRPDHGDRRRAAAEAEVPA